MSYLTTEFWDIVLNVIVLFCGISVLYFIRGMVKRRRYFLSEDRSKVLGDFHDVLVELIRQSEMAFEAISDTLRKECEVLQKLIEKGEIEEGKKKAFFTKEPKQNKRDLGGDGLVGDQYEEAVRLANLGLDIKEISKRVKIPKAELELIIKLRKKAHESQSIPTDRQKLDKRQKLPMGGMALD